MQAYQHDPDGRFIRALKSALPEYTAHDVFRMFREPYSLPELLGLVFSRIRERLEQAFGAPVEHATIGRPVRFSPDPRIDARTEEMLRTAAEGAGFRSIRFLSEPEAATRFYLSGEQARSERTVLIFDFGGGTLDLCVAESSSTGYRVLSTAGAHIGGTGLDRILFEQKLLPHLGKGQKWGRGLDLPVALFNRLVNPDANWRIEEQEYAREVRSILNATLARGSAARGLQALHSVVARRLGPDLFAAIEAAKVRLSDQESTEIRFQRDDVDIVEPLSREDLRTLFREPLDEIRKLIATALDSADRTARDIDRVLLAGGSSALVCTQELLRDLFGEDRVPLRQDLFTSIVSGLALEAAS
jgi:hypothetical chaperone protein